MEKEYFTTMMVKSMMVSGRMMKSMAKEFTNIKMTILYQLIGIKAQDNDFINKYK